MLNGPKLPQAADLLAKLDPKHRDAVLALARRAEGVWALGVRRLREALTPKVEEEKRGSALLRLVLAGSRWEALVEGPDLPEPQLFQEDCAFASEDGPLSPEALVRRAVGAIPEQLRSTIGRVVLASADASFEFADNRSLRVPDTDPEGARVVAAQQFGGAPAAFGFVPFGQSSEREQERRIYAFAQADRLRSYLYGLDKLALSLSAIVPLPALVLKTVAPEQTDTAQPYAVLFVGDYFAHFLVASPSTGAVAARTIQVGALSLAAAVASEMGLPLRQAASGLAQRDRLARLAPGKADAHIAAQTTIGALIAAPLRELGDSIEETIGYFVHQRLAGDPERLIVCGELDRLPGLAGWLSAYTGLTVETLAMPWHQVVSRPDALQPNLLEGAAKGLLTIGKMVYHFRNGRFVAEQPELVPAGAARKAGEAAAPSGKLGELTRALPWLRAPDARHFAGLAVLMVGLAIVDVKAFIGPSKDRLIGTAATYADLVAQNERMDAKRVAEMKAEAEDQAASLDPGSWSERLVAVAQNIGSAISLRRASLSNSGPGRRGAQSQLVLEGRLPRNGDYLGTIGSFVEALNREETFMRGLITLGFEGAKVAGESNAYVDFALTASYGGAPAPRKH